MGFPHPSVLHNSWFPLTYLRVGRQFCGSLDKPLWFPKHTWVFLLWHATCNLGTYILRNEPLSAWFPPLVSKLTVNKLYVLLYTILFYILQANFCGDGRIWTSDTFRYGGFRNRWIKPLSHISLFYLFWNYTCDSTGNRTRIYCLKSNCPNY